MGSGEALTPIVHEYCSGEFVYPEQSLQNNIACVIFFSLKPIVHSYCKREFAYSEQTIGNKIAHGVGGSFDTNRTLVLQQGVRF